MRFSFLFLLANLWWIHAQEAFTDTSFLMGSRFDITVVANNAEEAEAFIAMAKAEITRIEQLISSWKPNSETSKINKNAGISSVSVSDELYDLIERSVFISKITQGAFDITYAAMDTIWKFDGTMLQLPSPEKIEHAVSNISYQKLVIKPEKKTIYLPQKGMKIGFGAIGKGYAADAAKRLLKKNGVLGGIINASGDMNTWGSQSNGEPWHIAITNPLNKNKVFSWFDLSDNAVVTSGNYEKFVLLEGKRFSHIIDPRTGYPSTGIISCSVFAPSAEMADALATAVFVLGVENGLNLINQLPNIECVIILENGYIATSKSIEVKHSQSE